MKQLNIGDYRPKQSKTRADQMLEAFKKHHKENPHVWELFKKFTMQLITAGMEHYSSDAVCHRIRWHTTIETRGMEAKINDNYTAYYARLFHVAHPEHDGFFRNRKLISQEKPAHDHDLQFFDSGAPEGEAGLIHELENLLKG